MKVVGDRLLAGLRAFAADIGTGDVLDDRFELGRSIGRGGMSVVYAARDRQTGEEVAVKIVRRRSDDGDARFRREVTALRGVDHPAIVRIVAEGEHAGAFYVVMEHLAGRTLAERLVGGALGVSETIALAARIAGALSAAHAAGITHRDVKPSNIVLAGDSATSARLVDFGVARAREDTAVTKTGVWVGTPGYMAPEQVRAEADVGPAADVFALGCVVWECVMGRPAFSGKDDEELFARILLEDVPSLATETEVPAPLASLVSAMLKKDPSERPSMRDVAALLDEIRGRAPSGPGASQDPAAARIDKRMASIDEGTGIVEGTVVAGKYRVEHVLGAGGMGVVVAARHKELGTRVALKLLRSGDPSDHARFVREARVASRLTSEHVARVSDVGRTDDGTPYIVMEHLKGVDLGERLAERGPLPAATAVAHALEVCAAMEEAHALGIVHRDLKPSNLFLVERRDGAEAIKVLDFGISKITESIDETGSPPTLTDAKLVMGSIPYMSPEQISAPSSVDARSDIWSLGVVLFELLTGRRPFEGDNAAAVAARIAAAEPMRLRAVRPDAPAALERVIRKCLEKDRARRYPDVTTLARALRSVVHSKTTHGAADAPRASSRAWFALPLGAVVVAVFLYAARTAPVSSSAPVSVEPASRATNGPPTLAGSSSPLELPTVAAAASSAPPLVDAAPPAKPIAAAAAARAPTSFARAAPLDGGGGGAAKPPSPGTAAVGREPPSASGVVDLRDPALEQR